MSKFTEILFSIPALYIILVTLVCAFFMYEVFNKTGIAGIKNTKLTRITILVSILFIVILILTTVYSNKSQIFKLLWEFNLMPKEEHFTELYFTSYPALSSLQAVSGKEVNFSFTVNNLEGQDMTYPYEVRFNNSSSTGKLIDRGMLFITENSSKNISEKYTLTADATTGSISVSLLDKDLHILFYLPDKNII